MKLTSNYLKYLRELAAELAAVLGVVLDVERPHQHQDTSPSYERRLFHILISIAERKNPSRLFTRDRAVSIRMRQISHFVKLLSFPPLAC